MSGCLLSWKSTDAIVVFPEADIPSPQEWHGGAVVSNDWLWGPSYPRRSQQRVDDSEYGHETCIGSMITGETIGVSKAVTLYPVQVQWDMAAFLWIFSAISDDIARRRRRGSFRSGYITIYFPGYANQDFMNIYPNEFPRVRRRMQRLLDDDIIIITTAGNYAQVPGRENVDMFPGIWSSNTFPIIVVGSSDENGVKSFYSQAGNLVDVCKYIREIFSPILVSQSRRHWAQDSQIPMRSSLVAHEAHRIWKR